jgi:hypothetical protein
MSKAPESKIRRVKMSGKAESRLIYNSISTSERVSSLGVKGALLYTWLITHCDTQGRMPGKPKIVKQLVVPFIDEFTIEDVMRALEQMVERKLITLYEDDTGRPLVQVLDWWEWQTGLKYRAASHYQAPEGWEDRITTRDDNGRFAKE